MDSVTGQTRLEAMYSTRCTRSTEYVFSRS